MFTDTSKVDLLYNLSGLGQKIGSTKIVFQQKFIGIYSLNLQPRILTRPKNMSLKSRWMEHLTHGLYGFKIMFKCLDGVVEYGKFIKPLKEKLNQAEAINRCNGHGFIGRKIN